ncbi:MAG: zf-TFIIB domain-containing protein [Phycisphaerales bacterium]|jgi:Zn-finger nucleic acid-binding protein|nr:zf-TFIIB domain-containing protein [Phycisphaerales bacterium]
MDTDPRIACPNDGVTMDRLAIAGIAIDRCPSCGGIWLDSGELARVREASKAQGLLLRELDRGPTDPDATPLHARPQPLDCPRDGAHMSVHRDPTQKHVEFDVCPKCAGLFFDAGELSDLNELTLKERLRSMLG